MTAGKRHRCGRGKLQPREVQIRDEQAEMVLVYFVPGFVCDACGEELIDRETRRSYEATQTPVIIPITAYQASSELPPDLGGVGRIFRTEEVRTEEVPA